MWAPHLVCHPAFPSSANVAATISGVMEERRRKSIPFLYPDILFLHKLCKLVSREQKELSLVTEIVETFQMQWYSDKGWNNTAFMRFSLSCSAFFYCPYLVVSKIESYSFLNRHRTDMRRFHLCGSEVSGGCYVVPGFDRIEMVYFNILKDSQLNREIYGDRCCSQHSTIKMVVPWNLRYPPEPLECEVPSRMPGNWWQLCVSGAWVLECGGNSQAWPLHSDLSFESQTWARVYRVGPTGTSN